MFPNFLIIGANKGGTSSFYTYLCQHPQVFMSAIKEPMFFVYNRMDGSAPEGNVDENEPEWKNWKPIVQLEDYRELFSKIPPGVKAAGESSTAYLANPQCAERIHRFNPGMKIIAILREPVSRAFSNYLMYVRLGHEKRSFEDVVEMELKGERKGETQGRQYLALGYYADSVSEYQRVFGKNSVRIYLNEELKDHPSELFNDAFTFLGVDTSFRPDVREKFNVNEDVTLRGPMKDLIYRAGNKTRINSILPAVLQKKLRGDLRLSPQLRTRLKAMYSEDVKKLQSITGKDLSRWLR